MHITQNRPAVSWNSHCKSLSAFWTPKVNESYTQNRCPKKIVRVKEELKESKSLLVTSFANCTLSGIRNDQKSFKGYKKNNGRPTSKSSNHIYRKDVQLFYVFHNPFNRAKEHQIAQKIDTQKRDAPQVKKNDPECSCRCIGAETEACMLKDNCSCAKSISRSQPCTCNCSPQKIKNISSRRHKNEAKTQARLYARGDRESYYRETGTTCLCSAAGGINRIPGYNASNEMKSAQFCCQACIKNKEESFKTIFRKLIEAERQNADSESAYRDRGTTCLCSAGVDINRLPGFNVPNVIPTAQCCCQFGVKHKQDTFKTVFRKLIETEECRRLTNNLKQIIPQTNRTPCPYVEAETQSPSYGGWYQRAGRESFYREIGTSEIPISKHGPEPKERPVEDVSYEYDLLDEDTPATMNRRVGGNGKYNPKCCTCGPQRKQKFAHSAAYCKLDKPKNERGVLTVLCNMMLQPTNNYPGSNKCCKNRGTIYQGDHNEGGVIKKFCELLIEPKHGAPASRKSKNDLCLCPRPRDGGNTIKKFYQMILDPNTYRNKAKAEVMTQSRSYGRRQERAGREIFCKNRGTSGAPKPKKLKAKKEGYDDIEEFPTCIDCQPAVTNKGVGIGTNAKFTVYGSCKDRHAYGEGSLNCDTGVDFYNTNTATQSRKFRGRHLRAGRETFYRDAQTSYAAKNNKIKLDGNHNVINQAFPESSPNRKAIRWGSDCSFSLEISKDNPIDKSKPCGDKIDLNPNKKPNKSILRQLIQDKEREADIPSKSDACTCTDCCLEGTNVCQCNNLENTSQRRPLHIASKVSYHFNFAKSISPPKPESQDRQERTSPTPSICACPDNRIADVCPPNETCPAIVVESIEKLENLEVPSSDLPEKLIDKEAILKSIQSAKKCISNLMSRKNFMRLIKGEEKKVLTKAERLQSLLLRPPRNLKNVVCPADCTRTCQPAEKTDQPMRMKSRFSFDYNMQNVKPKYDRNAYEEKFLQLEDFGGSQTKLNFHRFIIGKLRKRKSQKTNERERFIVTCDPVECRKRKHESKSWFSYVLESIKQESPTISIVTATKNFFTRIMFDRLKKRKPKQSGIVSCLKEQLKETPTPSSKSSMKSFISEMLSRSDRGRRRRRRRRRGSSYSSSYTDDIETMDIDTLAGYILAPSRKTSDDDYPPCRVTSDCCFECNYDKLDNSDIETETTISTGSTKSTGSTSSTGYTTSAGTTKSTTDISRRSYATT